MATPSVWKSAAIDPPSHDPKGPGQSRERHLATGGGSRTLSTRKFLMIHMTGELGRHGTPRVLILAPHRRGDVPFEFFKDNWVLKRVWQLLLSQRDALVIM